VAEIRDIEQSIAAALTPYGNDAAVIPALLGVLTVYVSLFGAASRERIMDMLERQLPLMEDEATELAKVRPAIH
jgi:hypothetical protein